MDDLPETCAGPLVVLHPGFFREEELIAIQKVSGGDVAYIGYGGASTAGGSGGGSPPSFVRKIHENAHDYLLFCGFRIT